MRIIIDLQSCQNGSRHRGIGRYSLALSRALVQQGKNHEFLILLSDRFPGTVSSIFDAFEGLLPKESIIVFTSHDRTTSADPANAWRCRAAELLRADLLEGLKPDAVLIPSPIEGLWDNVITSIEPSSYLNVVTVHDLIPLTFPEQHMVDTDDRAAYIRKLEGVCRADVILTPSTFVRDEIVRELGIPAEKIFVTYEGAEASFSPSNLLDEDRKRLLEGFGITRPFVLNSSPLEYRKNLEGLIAAFGMLPLEIRKTNQLVIVGGMDRYGIDYLTRLAKAEGVPDDALILTGRVSDPELIDLYRTCTVFAFPSLSEGFGLPILEAMRCGAIAIGSNSSSIPEVIGDEECLFDPHEPVQIARIMARALTEDSWRSRVGKKQGAHARALNWPATAKRTLQAIEHGILRRRARNIVPVLSRPRPRLALVYATSPMASRSAGYIDTLLQILSPIYLVTPVDIGPQETPHWRSVVYEVKDGAWLTEHADQFDRILFVGHLVDLEHMEPWIRDHGGVALLLAGSAEPQISHSELVEIQRLNTIRDWHAVYGWGGIGQAAQNPPPFVTVSRHPVHGVIREAQEPGEQLGRTINIGTLPASLRGFSRAEMRSILGIPDCVPVIVVHVLDDATSAELITAFRTSRVAQEQGAHLVSLSRDANPRGELPTALSGDFPGRVHRKNIEEYNFYRRYMAMADAVYIDSDLGDTLQKWFLEDARSFGLPLLETAKPSAVDAILSVEAHATVCEQNLHDRGQGIADAIEGFYLTSPLNRYNTLFDNFPREVRSVAPSGKDLVDISRALTSNEALKRDCRIFIDLSGLGGGWQSTTSDARIIEIIRHALTAAIERRVEVIRFEGARFVYASREVASILGIPSNALSDDMVTFRSGDRIVGIDLFNAFPGQVLDQYLHCVERGVEFQVLIIGHRLDDLRTKDLIVAALGADLSRRQRSTQSITSTSAAASPGLEPRDQAVRLMAARQAGIPLSIHVLDEDSPLVNDLLLLAPDLELIMPSLPAVDCEPKPADDLAYTVTGHVLGSYSLAIINRAIARTIEEGRPGRVRLSPVETNPITDLSHIPEEERSLMESLATRLLSDIEREVIISQHYPVYVPVKDAETGREVRRIALFAHEESRIIASVARNLNEGFDAVMTPSTYVTKALIDSGVRIPVVTAGQPTKISPFRQLQRSSKPRPFTFIHISSCFPRKGPDLLLEAWSRAFRRGQPVRLIIKTFPNPHNDMESRLAELRERFPQLAPIELLNEDLDYAEMVRLYAGADAMVLPTRGEGYNLPALEAMLARVPLIVTDHGGHLDFCGPGEARLVRCRLEPSRSHVRSALSLWAEPDIDDLTAALREYASPAHKGVLRERVEHAYAAALAASDRTAWLDRVERISRQLFDTAPSRPPRIAWITTWQVQCGIAQHSEFLFAGLRETRHAQYRIICDTRTRVMDNDKSHVRAIWQPGEVPQRDIIGAEIEDFGADAVVIQHQDGLISWRELGRIANDPRFNRRVLILVLHNPRAIAHLNTEEREQAIDALRRASRVVVHSVSDVNLLASFGLARNVTLLPPGALPGRGRREIVSSSPHGDGPLIGCHGFAFPHKGFDQLLRAVAMLRSRWPNLRLRMVTAQFPDEKSRKTIEDLRLLAEQLGLHDEVEWHTDFLPVEEILDLLSACDLLILPYEQSQDSASGAARICLSSLAPTLATRVKIFEEMQDAFEGVENNDPHTLHDAIDRLLTDAEARIEIQNRMADWLSEFDWGHMMTLMEGMIEGLVSQRRMGWV